MTGRRAALIVATDSYEDSTLHSLAAPAADSRELAEVLSDATLGGFEVDTLTNPAAHEVRMHVEQLLADAAPDDLLVMHFSCHGLKNETGELMLAAADTRSNLLESTGVHASWVSRMMQRSRARSIVLFLDCCYGGAFDRGFVSRADTAVHVAEQFDQGRLGEGRGRVVVTASGATEFALEGSELSQRGEIEPSVFTRALVEGIRGGAADRDEDGYVTLDELYEHIFNQVRSRTPTMTPEMSSYGQRGMLHIARSPRRRIVPADPPAELLAALTGSHFSRVGATEALIRIARGTDLPAAMGAILALQALCADDSRAISGAATEALAAARPQLSQDVIDLGTIPQGDEPYPLELAVVAPPVGLACMVECSSPRLRAVLEDGALRIGVEVKTLGEIAGEVRLVGPAGDASVALKGRVAPSGPPRSSPTESSSLSVSAEPDGHWIHGLIRDAIGNTSKESVHIAPQLPSKKLQNARRCLSLPPGESVLCLFDFTVFGSGKSALVLGESGFYHRNGTETFAMTYDDLGMQSIQPVGGYGLTIGSVRLNAGGCRDEVVEALRAIQGAGPPAAGEPLDVAQEPPGQVSFASPPPDLVVAPVTTEWRRLVFELRSGDGNVHTIAYSIGLWYTLQFDGQGVRRYSTAALKGRWSGTSFVRMIGTRRRLLELAVGHRLDGARIDAYCLSVDGVVLSAQGESPPAGLTYKHA